MIKDIIRSIRVIKQFRKEARELIKLTKNMSHKDKHIIHLNRYFYLLSGIKREHRFCKKELSSIYSINGIDTEMSSEKCSGHQPYVILAK
tara:strand:- start:46 stop:315 length:270 start_codon:yes stop_codon:yes gene_type:complete